MDNPPFLLIFHEFRDIRHILAGRAAAVVAHAPEEDGFGALRLLSESLQLFAGLFPCFAHEGIVALSGPVAQNQRAVKAFPDDIVAA